MKKSSSWFGHLLSKCTKHEEDCVNFCVLLRKSELYHVTKAGRNRVKNEKGTDAFIYLVQNVDLNKNGSNTKMTFEVLQIKHGLAPWGG